MMNKTIIMLHIHQKLAIFSSTDWIPLLYYHGNGKSPVTGGREATSQMRDPKHKEGKRLAVQVCSMSQTPEKSV